MGDFGGVGTASFLRFMQSSLFSLCLTSSLG